MGGSFFGKIFFGGSRRLSNKQAERRREALRRGPSSVLGKGVLERIPLIGSRDKWTMEKERQQEIILKQYQQQKREITRQRRQAEVDLKKSLERRRQGITSHYEKFYRMGKYGKSEVGEIKKAERDIERKYQIEEGRMKRSHREQWQKRLHELQRWRDRERRSVTEKMRGERREMLGLPTKRKLPWEL